MNPKVIAKIEILMTEDGRVVVNHSQLSLAQFNLMISGAIRATTEAMAKKAQGPQVEAAPPGFSFAINGQSGR